ncbi:hypothetical protein K1719_003519 [Acacia pycnantha]|nr:hypothetical protein K1719_003519 [Acacia pycnantha]
MKRKAKKAKPRRIESRFFYNELGHLKRNCKLNFEDLEKNKKDSGAIASSIYAIDIRFSTSSTWVLDTTYTLIDRGGEYLSQEFIDHLRSCGIVSQLTPPEHLNGMVFRAEESNSIRYGSIYDESNRSSTSLWGNALETAAFTLNRVPSKAVEKTPYEIWTGKKPSLSFLKIWGCEVYVKHQASDKLSSRSSKCLFVGYPKETKGYYVYNPTDHKVFVIRNGIFWKKS